MELDVISHSFEATINFLNGIVEKYQKRGPKIMAELSRITALPTVGVVARRPAGGSFIARVFA